MSNYNAFMVLCVVSPAMIVIGLFSLADYSSRPCSVGDVVLDLNTIELDTDHDGDSRDPDSRQTLILFYHPHCPCTVATLRCLERLSPSFSTRPRVFAYAYCIDDQPDSWISSTTTHAIKQIPDSKIIIDRNAEICLRFGVQTSGHVLLYNAGGQLIFSGGITPYRGHEGNCLASSDLLTKVNGNGGRLTQWPVFGCAIVASEVPK